MKILVTGGTGFIGQFLVKALVQRGDQVKVLVRQKKGINLMKKWGAEPILGNLTTLKPRDLHGIDVVYHLAAIRTSWGHPWEDYYQTNVLGTRNLLAASQGKVKHFILMSSYKAVHPKSPYGQSKFLAEKEAVKFFKKEKLPLTIIRPAIVYGPRDDSSGMIPKLFRLIKNRIYITVGSGKNRLHLVYIDDLIRALLLAAKKKGRGRIYTIAGERPIELNQLVSLIAQEFKVKLLPVKIPLLFANLTGAILEPFFKEEPIVTRNKVKTLTENTVFRIDKAKREIGYLPQVDYLEGIKKTVAWYQKQWKK